MQTLSDLRSENQTKAAISPFNVPTSARLSDSPWTHGVALLVALYLIYAPVFLTDYLMNDEWYAVGTRPGLRYSAKSAFFIYGRALFGIYSTLVYRFAGYDPFRIQLVRFVNFASLASIALLLFFFLHRLSKNSWLSGLAILFLFSQPPFQGAMAYAFQLISNSQPAMWLSLLAFYVYFYARRLRIRNSLRAMAVFLLLLLAMQSTQTYAFFNMAPLAYLALADWKNQRRRVVEFLAIALVVLVVSTVVYKVGLAHWHGLGKQGYWMGEAAVTAVGGDRFKVALHAVNPFAYWSAFQVWNFSFPFHSIGLLDNTKVVMACIVMAGWAVLLLWTFVDEIREQGWRAVSTKWLAFLGCLGFAAVFIVADSPLATIDHRPHILMTFVAVVVLSAAYCLQALSFRHPSLQRPLPKVAGVIAVLMVAFGAQAGTLRGYVTNRMKQLNFVRTELMGRQGGPFQDIVVVLPQWTGCLTEPCGIWPGHVTEQLYYLSGQEGYKYALATLGISPAGKVIRVVGEPPKDPPPKAVVIDWQRYSLARKREANR